MEGPGIDDIQPVPRPAPRPRQHENPAILPPGRGAGVSLIQGDWTIDISIGFTLNLVWRTLYKGWGVPPEVPGHWWVPVSLWSYLRLTICHSTQPPLPHLLIWCWPGAEGPRSHIWYNCGHRELSGVSPGNTRWWPDILMTLHYGKLRGIRQAFILGAKIIILVEVLCLHVKLGRDLDI